MYWQLARDTLQGMPHAHRLPMLPARLLAWMCRAFCFSPGQPSCLHGSEPRAVPIQQCTLQLSVLQVGELFRTSAFNLHARKNGPPRSLDTLTLKELYAMKAGIENRSLSAKMLAQLYEPQEGVHVQVGGLSAPRTASGHFFTSSSLAQIPRGASTPTALAACNAARVDLSASGTHRFVSACPCDDETAILHPHCTWQCIWPPQCKPESCEWRLPARNVGSLWTASFPCAQSTSLLNTPLLTQSLKSSVVSRNAQLASIHNQRMRRKREAAAAAAAAVAAAAGPAMTQQQMTGARSKGGTGVLL